MLLRKLAVPQDRPENVVEVMRNAAGQRADRLQLVGLPQLRLQVFLVDLCLLFSADVACRADEPIRLAGSIAQTTATCEQPTPLPARLPDAIFALITRCAPLEM